MSQNAFKGFLLSPFGIFLVVATIGFALLASSLFALSRQGGHYLDECPTPTGSGSSDTPIDLGSNRARPSLSIPVADNSGAVDDISLSPKKSAPIPGDVRAYLIEYPRQGSGRSLAQILVTATPSAGGTAVQVKACIKRGSLWEAGSYEGTIRVFGGNVRAFDYPLIITERWPWEAAAGLLILSLVAFITVTYVTDSLTFQEGRQHPWLASIFGVVLATLAIAPTFFGTYWNNATWGSNPATQVGGLVAAGFTAATAGLALAHKLIPTK
jgi:hypothetical protein